MQLARFDIMCLSCSNEQDPESWYVHSSTGFLGSMHQTWFEYSYFPLLLFII